MKLLYATSITYPSNLANRYQTIATAGALARALPGACTLGLAKLSTTLPFETLVMGSSHKSPVLAWRYLREVRKGGFTHFYTRESRLLFFFLLFARLTGTQVRSFFEAHTIEPGALFTHIVRRVDGVVSISNGLAEDLISLGVTRSRILVAPDAVDIARFASLPRKEELRAELNIPPDTFVVGYAGSFTTLHSWKGTDVLLEAARLNADPRILFILIGAREDELPVLRARYPMVRIEGQWSFDRVPRFLRAADLLVLPNKKGQAISERHTSPMKLFEYMASGTPMIASDLPSIREIASNEDIYFIDPNDPVALSEAVQLLHANPEQRTQLAHRAMEKVQNYTWDTRAAAIIAFLRFHL